MVGSSILRILKNKGYENIIIASRNEMDLTKQERVYKFLKNNRPDAVIIAAAKVGGIYANNTFRADFLYQNLSIQNNLIHGSYLSGVKNLIFLGSSCIYPKFSKQPIKEDYLLSGKLEPTNEPYAIAKIAGLKLCENYNFQYGTNYKCLMPCNLYGPGDNYDQLNSHFFPALIRKIHEVKLKNKKFITLWGDGSSLREMMYVDDLANAAIFFMRKNTSHTLINVGSNEELSIREYLKFMLRELNLSVSIRYDKSKPNGTPRKLIDSSIALSYGWKPKISLTKGFKKTYKDFIKNHI